MIELKVTQLNGAETRLQTEPGKSLMEALVHADVDGIPAECGGACACATCHVVVNADWFEKLPSPEEVEAEMLEFAETPTETSRLSCQVMLTAELDGLAIEIPPNG